MKSAFTLRPLYCALLLAMPNLALADNTKLADIEVDGRSYPLRSEHIDNGTKTTLSEQELQRTRAASLGETVEQVSGVHNHNFGPAGGLPQIRSLTGPRVYISENGLGVSDLSAISGNLPTPVQPFLAEKITVRKSSAAVLYGGSAVGGAVDVETRQIPDTLPERDFGGKVEISGGYNTPHNQIFRLNGNVDSFAWHLSGQNSKISSYRIPGNSKAGACYNPDEILFNSPLRHLCQVEAEINYPFDKRLYRYVMKDYLTGGESWRKEWELGRDEVYSNYDGHASSRYWTNNPDYDASIPPNSLRELKSLQDAAPVEHGKLTNSHMHLQSLSVGVSYIGERGYIGIGLSRYLNRYGVPGYASLATRSGDANSTLPVNINADQTRWQAEGMYRPHVSWLDNIRFRAAHTDADNREYLGRHFADSLNSRSQQIRLEFNHRPASFMQGTLGMDWRHRRIDSSGPDRYMPNTKTHEYALFAIEKFHWQNWEAELGWRHGRVKHQALLDGYQPGRGLTEGYLKDFNQREYSLNSQQAAFRWKPWDIVSFGVRYNRSQRAPEVNELFASNRHFAILTNEHGDPRLNPETASTWEFGGELNWRQTQLRANFYHTDFKDYTYLGQTGTNKGDGLPYKEWRQGDTRIHGIELEWSQYFDLGAYGLLEGRLFADWVKNRPVDQCGNPDPADSEAWKRCVRYRSDGAYMPGLPTTRYGIGLRWQKGGWQLASSLTRYAAQRHRGKVINEEVDLGGYNLWDAYLSYTHNFNQHRSLEWFVDARNLGNVEARPHNSTLKYLAPLPGRSLRTGLRLSF